MFVTYARCRLQPDAAIKQLLSLLPDLSDYAVAREMHADGRPHLHLLLRHRDPKNSKFDIRNPRDLDLVDGSKVRHPNIQAAREPERVLYYLSKV